MVAREVTCTSDRYHYLTAPPIDDPEVQHGALIRSITVACPVATPGLQEPDLNVNARHDSSGGAPAVIAESSRPWTDLNRDGILDLLDSSVLLRAFGRCDDSPLFNVAADFNRDGCVTPADAAIFVDLFEIDRDRQGDFDRDGDVDLADIEEFTSCVSGPCVRVSEACLRKDLDRDDDVDLSDFGILQTLYTGASPPRAILFAHFFNASNMVHTIERFDWTTGSRLSIVTWDGPNVAIDTGLALAPSRNSLFLVDEADKIWELDIDTLAVRRSYFAGRNLTGLAFDQGVLYGLVSSGSIVKLDPDSGSLQGTLGPFGGSGGLDAAGGRLFSRGSSPTRIIEISETDGGIVRSFDLPPQEHVTGIAFNGASLFVATATRNLHEIDPDTGAIVRTANQPRIVTALAAGLLPKPGAGLLWSNPATQAQSD